MRTGCKQVGIEARCCFETATLLCQLSRWEDRCSAAGADTVPGRRPLACAEAMNASAVPLGRLEEGMKAEGVVRM